MFKKQSVTWDRNTRTMHVYYFHQSKTTGNLKYLLFKKILKQLLTSFSNLIFDLLCNNRLFSNIHDFVIKAIILEGKHLTCLLGQANKDFPAILITWLCREVVRSRLNYQFSKLVPISRTSTRYCADIYWSLKHLAKLR